MEPCGWPVDEPCDDNYGLPTAEEARQAEEEAIFILWSLTHKRYGLCDVEVELYSCSKYVVLPGPVHEVKEVYVDGELYENWLFVNNELILSNWFGKIRVVYVKGLPVPAGAARVVSELARQLAYAKCNPSKCVIPANLIQRTRRGDTVKLDKELNMPRVAIWIKAANMPVASVWSPDVATPTVTTLGGSS